MPPRDDLRRGYARGRARDEEIRAGLVPLSPGERPVAVTVAAVVALLLGFANIALLAVGADVNGEDVSALAVVVFAALTFAMAYGLLQATYWVVLVFEALLGVTIVVAALSLMVASNGAAIALCLGIMALGGWLFWALIRVMARLQAPTSS